MAGNPQQPNMDLEYFKPVEPLGAPGGSAKPIKLAGAALALAAAAAAMFFFYVITTALSIGSTTAAVEVRLMNRRESQDIWWQLVQGPPPENPPPGTPALLEEDQEVLYLENLEPCTEYTLVFLEYDQHGAPFIVHTFTFVTDCGGKPQIPEPPPADPPADPPEAPPVTPPAPPPEEPPVTPPAPPPEDPPVTPPYVPGGGEDGGSGGTPSKTFGEFAGEAQSSLNRFEYDLDYSVNLPEKLSVTMVIAGYTPGTYDFQLTGIYIDSGSSVLVEGTDYTITDIKIGQEITVTFDLPLKTEWIGQGYVPLDASILGANFENGVQVGSDTSTYVRGQINLEPGYPVEPLTSLLGQSLLGMTVDGVWFYTESLEGSELAEVVEDQTVTIQISLRGPATADGTISVHGNGPVACTPHAVKGIIDVKTGDPENYLEISFNMPPRKVTEDDLKLTLTASPTIISVEAAAPPALSVPIPAPVPGASTGPHSVGPIVISESIHGLNVLSATFSAAGTEASQLSDVAPGETVYLNILLQGVSMKTFRLGAAFASTLPDLQVMQGHDVSIGDADAYLRASFTMPNRSVTAADIGFLGFTAN